MAQCQSVEANIRKRRLRRTGNRTRYCISVTVVADDEATWAATNSVDPSLKLHSLCVRRPSGPHAHSHSYFLSFGSNEKPIVYHVEKLRDGRSYATRTVKAVQNGNAIFTLTASFQKPEPAQPRFSIPMPKGPATIEGTPEDWLSLEASTPQEVEIQNELDERGSDMSPKMREYLMRFMEERRQSSIEVRAACPRRPRRTDRSVEPVFEQGFWIRSRQKGVDDGAFQKCDGDDQCRADARRCILAYASDLQFIGTAARALGLSARSNPRLAMMASLDHSIWFYDGA